MGNSDSKKIDKKIVGYKVVSDDAKAEPITEADNNILKTSRELYSKLQKANIDVKHEKI